MAVVEVELQGRTFYILEVDTSDGVCSLSTLLLRGRFRLRAK
ncbi:Tn7-like element transposition protein TnsE [Escherichia coli]